MISKSSRLSGENKLILSMFFPVLAEQAALTLLVALHQMMLSNIDNCVISVMSLIDQIYIFSNSALVCITTGASILTAQYFGAGKIKSIKRLAKSSMLTGFAISMILLVLFVAFPRQILTLVYPYLEGEMLNQSATYLALAGIAFPFFFVFTNCSGILRGCLNTRAPLVAALVSSFVNITVSLVLMYVFELGIVGVGIGLLTARILSSLVAYIFMKKHIARSETEQEGVEAEAELLPMSAYLGQIMRLGVFVLMEHVIFNFGKMMLQGYMIKAGDVHVTANAIATSLLNMFIIPGTAMSVITLNITGKYKGSGDDNRAFAAIKKFSYITGIMNGVVAVVSISIMRLLIGLFTSDTQVIELTYKLLMISAFSLPFAWAVATIPMAGLRGIGDTRFPAILASASMWAFRIPLNYILMSTFNLGAVAVWISMCAEWFVYSFILIGNLAIKKKKMLKTGKENSERKKIASIIRGTTA